MSSFKIVKVKFFKTSSLHYMFGPAFRCIMVGLGNCCAFSGVAFGV
jgi:hypothetical protein